MPTRRNSRAAQGAGTIRQRPDGRWEARYTVGRDPGTGKQIQRSIYGTTQKEVLKKLQEAAASIENGTYAEPARMTVGQWLDIWLSDFNKEVKERTYSLYKSQIEYRIKPAIGAVKLVELKPHVIQSFYNQQGQDMLGKQALSPKSIKNLHGILHKALQQAVEAGYIKINPSGVCKLPRIIKAEIKPFDDVQIAAFLRAIEGHVFEVLYKVDLFTGLRQGEIIGLTWDCIDFQKGTIYVYQQLQRIDGIYRFAPLKNDKSRCITPAPWVMEALQKHRAEQLEKRMQAGNTWTESNLVFTNDTGRHLVRDTVYKKYKTIASLLGMPYSRFHDLRHSYAVAALQSGDDVKTVQENLGHHTAAFTLDTYAHVTDRMKQESAARMETYIQHVTNDVLKL